MKLIFDEALQRLNNGQRIECSNVLRPTLERRVWIARWECWNWNTRINEVPLYCATKADAIAEAIEMAEHEDSFRDEIRDALIRQNRWEEKRRPFTNVTTITSSTLREAIESTHGSEQ